jgi:DNA-binding SARP family transcriptional activator
VPNEVLVDRLWGVAPPAKAADDLRAYASRLNRRLRQVADDETRLVAQSRGYALAVDPQSVDLHRFRLFGRQAAALAHSGDDEQAISLLQAGDVLWRGQALENLAGDWISRMRAGLEEERRLAIVKRIDLQLRLGHHLELIGELNRLTDEYPLDETFCSHQMTALYRSGRQADALRVYREAHHRLAAEGIHPSPALANLHQTILRHDPNLAITPAFRRPGRSPQPNTLPSGTGDFVGRTDEITQITQHSKYGNSPLVQIIEGMPGVGKTAFAVQVARRMTRRYPDAQLFLDFHSHASGHVPLRASEALYSLLEMLGVPSARIPGNSQERASLWQAELAHRRMIIVLDDVWDLDEVRSVLPVTGDNLIIITSRRRHVPRKGTVSRVLDALPVDDAIALFTRVSGRQVSEADQVARAVTMCGRLPLAICVSASRLRHGNLPGLPELLDELSRLAVGHDLAGSMSQQIMSAFEMSYQGLTFRERTLLRSLGISPCPATSIHAVMALTDRSLAEVQNGLGSLLDRHLVTESSPGYFQLHDIIHAYAASRSADEDSELDQRSAIGRLLHYYLQVTRKATQIVFAWDGKDPVPVSEYDPASPVITTLAAGREWLKAEWRNILSMARHAARHEWKRQCADLTDALAEFLEANGFWDEASEAYTLALQACRDAGDDSKAARAALHLTTVELLTGQQESALLHANEAVALSRRLGDQCGEAAALDLIGIFCYQSARFRDALAHHQESADIYSGSGDLRGMALALCHAGMAYSSLGRLVDVVGNFDQALNLYRQAGDRRGQALMLNNIGSAQYEQGLYRDAMRNFEESRRIFQELDLDEMQNFAVLEHNIGTIHDYKGDHDKALAMYRKAFATYRAIGDLRLQACILCDIGSAYQGKEYYEEALAHHERARAIAESMGERYMYVKALCGIAEAEQGSGRNNAALDTFKQAFGIAREIESPAMQARALQGIGNSLLHIKGAESARIYFRQALDLWRQLRAPEATNLEIRLETLTESA